MGTGTLNLLMYLSQKSGLHGSFKTSTNQISAKLNISQQTVSRKLRNLEEKGLIQRDVDTTGINIQLSDNGRDLLHENYNILKGIFGNTINNLNGEIFAGLGEGKYYVSLEGYKKQFKDKLNFEPYPGTLNMNVDKTRLKGFLSGLEKIEILGFNTEERTFGGIDCYKINIKNIPAAIILPHRTLHAKSVIEIISPVYLRDKLRIQDGENLEIQND